MAAAMLDDVVAFFTLTPDAKPVISDIRQFLDFPMDRMRADSPLAVFMHPAVPILGVLFYCTALKPLVRAFVRAFDVQPKATWLRCAVILHNVLLAVYSAYTFYATWELIYNHASERGFYSVYCDPDGSLWRKLEPHAFHFYLSKYYEWIDTVILVLKGKKVSLLQAYHHAGIVLAMWANVATGTTSLFWVLGLNAGVHTIMYTYYGLTAAGFKVAKPKMLTQAQVVQFIVGISVSAYVHPLGDSCSPYPARMALACMQVYAAVLIPLFVQFFISAYSKKPKPTTGAGPAPRGAAPRPKVA